MVEHSLLTTVKVTTDAKYMSSYNQKRLFTITTEVIIKEVALIQRLTDVYEHLRE